MTRHSALNEIYPEARVENPSRDAEIHGIRNGDSVRLQTRRGKWYARHRNGKGAIGVILFRGILRKPPVNLLTNDALDPQALIPSSRPARCRFFLHGRMICRILK